MRDYSELIEKSLMVRKFAYVPYSDFAVGAALLTSTGRIFTGCNVESAAYSVCNCAERTAFFKAVSEGFTTFEAIAVVGGKKGEEPSAYCPPCGVCRQVMLEFCDPETFQIVLSNGSKVKTFALEELLPFGFSRLE